VIARQPAEWLAPRAVLMCAPSTETLFGVLSPASSNFLRPFSVGAARREHEAFRAALDGCDIRTIDVREALAGDGVPRERLEAWARESVALAASGLRAELLPAAEAALADALAAFGRSELVDLMLLRPTLALDANPRRLDPTSALAAGVALAPLSNACYVRDPLMTTPAGVVVGRLRLDVRAPETVLARRTLEALGIDPLLEIAAPGTLEGGDFIPCGDYVLQGVGLLTNRDGVAQCLAAGAYGAVDVVVVEDRRAAMDEMHLDTYCAVLAPDLAALCEDRLGDGAPPAHVYEHHSGADGVEYRFRNTLPLDAYFAERGLRVVAFTKDEQRRYASNGLLVAPGTYAVPRQAGPDFLRRLQDVGVTTIPLDFETLGCGYGGPHCSTQVLVRA
jgi:arginine deiminase